MFGFFVRIFFIGVTSTTLHLNNTKGVCLWLVAHNLVSVLAHQGKRVWAHFFRNAGHMNTYSKDIGQQLNYYFVTD